MKDIPLPIIIWFLAKAITTLWGKRVHLVRSFQERLSELGMGRFIAHYEQRDITKGQLESFMEMLISAYLCIISVPAILSVYGKEVMETVALDSFFQKYEDYNVWRTVKEKMAEEQYIDMPKRVILETIIEKYNMPELEPRMEDFLRHPYELMRCIIGSIWDVVESLGMDIGKIVDHVNQKYQTYRFDPWMGLLSPMFWRVVHPTLDLDWSVIKSYIAMLDSYRLIRGYKDYAGFVDPFLSGQIVKVLYDGKVKAFEHLGEEGLIKISIPYDDVEEKVTLDSFGLKIDIPKQAISIERVCAFYDPPCRTIDDIAYWRIVNKPWGQGIIGWEFHLEHLGTSFAYRDLYTWSQPDGDKWYKFKLWRGIYYKRYTVYLGNFVMLDSLEPTGPEGKKVLDGRWWVG